MRSWFPSPKVTVMDNSSCNDLGWIFHSVYYRRPSNAGSNVRFESATTSLNVTPHITNDGSISMQISATRNEPNFSQLVQGNPIVDQRQASTKVLVKSGNTNCSGWNLFDSYWFYEGQLAWYFQNSDYWLVI